MSESEPIRLTRAQVREIDRLAVERYHMPSILLMENAARELWMAALTLLTRKRHEHGPVLLVCGSGNNGGDGFALARLMHDRDTRVRVLLTAGPEAFRGDALIEWNMLRAWGVPVEKARPDVIRDATTHLIVDAIFGTGLNRAPDGQTAGIIQAINDRKTLVLAVDVPSGLDCDTGEPYGPCVRATRTMTFVAEKTGFANARSKEFTGEVLVGDIGCPRELIDEVAKMSP